MINCPPTINKYILYLFKQKNPFGSSSLAKLQMFDKAYPDNSDVALNVFLKRCSYLKELIINFIYLAKREYIQTTS